MTVQAGAGRKPRPFFPRKVQAGGGHTAAHDFNLAVQTESLWYHGSGSSMSYAWPDPGSSPIYRSALVGLGSQVAMQIGDVSGVYCDLDLPWFSQLGVTRIEAFLMVAVYNHDVQLQLALQTSTLVSAVATATGPLVTVVPTYVPHGGMWTRLEPQVRAALVRLTVEPTYPADRRIAVNVDARWEPYNADPDGTGSARTAKLMGMMIRDVMPEPMAY